MIKKVLTKDKISSFLRFLSIIATLSLLVATFAIISGKI